jgi:rod shape-determining protein MreB
VVDLGASSCIIGTPEATHTQRSRAIAAKPPCKAGHLGDVGAATQAMRALFGEVGGAPSSALILTSASLAPGEAEAWGRVARAAGARRVTLVPRVVAIALGAGPEAGTERGALVVDLGAAHVELALLALGGLVEARSVALGVESLDPALIAWARAHHGLLISSDSASAIRRRIGAASTHVAPVDLIVRGRDQLLGEVRELRLTRAEVVGVYQPWLAQLSAAVLDLISHMPPELCADLEDHGALLAGGGANLPGLDQALGERCGLAFRSAPDPERCAVRGGLAVLGAPDRLRRLGLDV